MADKEAIEMQRAFSETMNKDMSYCGIDECSGASPNDVSKNLGKAWAALLMKEADIRDRKRYLLRRAEQVARFKKGDRVFITHAPEVFSKYNGCTGLVEDVSLSSEDIVYLLNSVEDSSNHPVLLYINVPEKWCTY